MPSKKVIVAVTNDLFTDQRVDKICRFLTDKGADVLLVGRKLANSKEIVGRPYQIHRFNLKFTKGALFYAEYNIRLFLFLLFNQFDFVVSNDLDTLPACDLAAASKGKKLVYDSHEYFTEVPELQNNPIVKKIWESFEIMIFRNRDKLYTVNEAIAEIYNKKYHVQFKVVRNLPLSSTIEKNKTRNDLDLPLDKKILILQGAGINIERGAEELCMAMKKLENCFLVVVGSGDVFPILNKMIQEDEILNRRIKLVDKLPYQEMMQYTLNADIGFSLDKDTNLNYRFSLPNKLFDYFRAGIPVIVTDLVVVGNLVRKFQTGRVVKEVNVDLLVDEILNFLNNQEELEFCRQNTKAIMKEMNWENETKVLEHIYNDLL